MEVGVCFSYVVKKLEMFSEIFKEFRIFRKKTLGPTFGWVNVSQ